MFITQAFKPNNTFWKYLVGSLIVIVASFIGQIPLVACVLIKSTIDKVPFPTSDTAIMKCLEPNLTLFLLLLSFVVAMVAFYFVIQKLHHQTFLEATTSRAKIDWKRIWFSFSLWAIFSTITVIIDFYINPENFIVNFKPVPFAILFVIATLMIPIQTSMEEYIFRGYLMQGFALLAKNKWFPLLMTSLIFGSLHFMNPEVDKLGYIIMVYYIGTGLFLGILTLMDDGMELSLGFHAANNLIGALLVTSDWTVFQTHSVLKDISTPEAGFDVILPVIVVYPILLFIFSKKYGWTNWKERLMGKIIVEDLQKNELSEIGIGNE